MREGPAAEAASRSRARRWASVAAVVVLLPPLPLLSGCAREAPDLRAARKTAQGYLNALARVDLPRLKELSTNVPSTGSVRGGRILAIDPATPLRLGALDSLDAAAARRQAAVDSAWVRAGERDTDSLFQIARRASRARVVYRNARRAALISAARPDLAAETRLEARRVRVRIRYGGELVGPRPVDRELNLRLLRAAEGPWIVYSLYLPEDDPIAAAH